MGDRREEPVATAIARGNDENGGESAAKRLRTSSTSSQAPETAALRSKNASLERERELKREKQPVCVLGLAVVLGTSAREACSTPAELEAALLRSVQTDNAKFLSHVIVHHGWRPDGVRSNCNFGITIDKASAAAERKTTKLERSPGEAETPATNTASSTATQEVWRVSSATPLHLALSCGSFKAAAVLLIAFPEFATKTCSVTTPTNEQLSWSCFELAQFSSSQLLAAAQEEDGERERGRKRGREGGAGLPLAPPSSFLLRALLFQQASLVLLQLRHGIPSSWTFLHFASPRERLEAAGEDPDLLLQALVSPPKDPSLPSPCPLPSSV